MVPSITEDALMAFSGDQTIIITLTGDLIWVSGGAFDGTIKQNIINGLVSSGSETNGWNNSFRPNMDPGNVVRTSNTVVTISILAANAGEYASYDITETETITCTVPLAAIGSAVEDVVADNTFSITVEAARDTSGGHPGYGKPNYGYNGVPHVQPEEIIRWLENFFPKPTRKKKEDGND
jgi:hypothetical protein